MAPRRISRTCQSPPFQGRYVGYTTMGRLGWGRVAAMDKQPGLNFQGQGETREEGMPSGARERGIEWRAEGEWKARRPSDRPTDSRQTERVEQCCLIEEPFVSHFDQLKYQICRQLIRESCVTPFWHLGQCQWQAGRQTDTSVGLGRGMGPFC